MKITFSNLGAIKKTTLDLRPLTVIIGPNNSNKTYIAYSIYGLFNFLSNVINNFYESGPYPLEVDENLHLFDIDKNFVDSLNEYSGEAIHHFENSLENYFQDTSKKIFEHTTFKVNFIRKDILQKLDRLFLQKDNILEENIDVSFNSNSHKLLLNTGKYRKNEIEYGRNHYDVLVELLGILTSLMNFKPYLLPTERNSFIITYKMLANRRYKLLRDTQRGFFNRRHRIDERQLELLKEQGDIRYPQPIEDFLDFLTDVELEKNTKKVLKERFKFHELANKIEDYIQLRNKTNFKSTKFGGKEIRINVKKGLDIDLYNASSSIKQLAPLLLYLRYRAKENDLLIIDEPEMNLHPESQAKLLEVLAMLVNAGVNVLLTTHSPYFMSHLNNLIAGDMSDDATREKQAKSLYLEDARAFLKPEDVSAYEMRQNKAGNQTLHDLHDKDYGIRWDTLSDVSADIQQKYFEIYEKGETSSGKKK